MTGFFTALLIIVYACVAEVVGVAFGLPGGVGGLIGLVLVAAFLIPWYRRRGLL
jgi:hypothetical protein